MTLRARWSALTGLLLSACSLPSLAPVALDRVADAPLHPQAKSLTLTAQSVREVRGVGQWSIRHSRAVGTNDVNTHEMWVVPLVDPGAEIDGPVAAWVTSPENHPAGASPEDWFARLAAELDGKTVTLKVAVRASEARENGSGWGLALADAESRLGVQSNPSAPVLFFPSP